MQFKPEQVYHVYNRGNNRMKIFFNQDNYLFFLKKVRTGWLPQCNILAYCLMPNHFHFLIQPTVDGCLHITLKNKPTHLQHLSKTIGNTLSAYTQAVNIQNNTTGNLFQRKTKAKCITEDTAMVNGYDKTDYLTTCFLYIHNNPLEAGLVKNLRDWPYSSWPDYYGFRNGSLCNKTIMRSETGACFDKLLSGETAEPEKKIIENIW